METVWYAILGYMGILNIGGIVCIAYILYKNKKGQPIT